MKWHEIVFYIFIFLLALGCAFWEYTERGTFYSFAPIIALGAYILGIFNRYTLLCEKCTNLHIEYFIKPGMHNSSRAFLLCIKIINLSQRNVLIKEVVAKNTPKLVDIKFETENPDRSIEPTENKCFYTNILSFYTDMPQEHTPELHIHHQWMNDNINISVKTYSGFEKTIKISIDEYNRIVANYIKGDVV